ncbi:MAG: enoyl-CoA hydratase-related protein [Pseudomonadota bacterium]
MTDTPPLTQLSQDDRGVATITLNRPQVHNAFNAALITQLHQDIVRLDEDESVRVLVLTGEGRSFSAGADLNGMKEIAQVDEQSNMADALALADMLRRLAYTKTPTVARVNGAAYGGGVGLIACCDVAIGSDDARFGLTETRLGLVPAVISPYVINALGARQANRLFLTARIFAAHDAERLGLLHRSVPAAELDAAVNEEIDLLMKAGPQALFAAKSLVGAVSGRTEDSQKALDQATAKLIASLRVSPEGREGITAFLEKRAASWVPPKS